MSTPSAAAGPAVRDFPPRRPFQGGGRFDKPVLSQEQIDVLIRQRGTTPSGSCSTRCRRPIRSTAASSCPSAVEEGRRER